MSHEDLFGPDSVAIIGASATPGKLGNDAMINMKEYDKPIYPINPDEEGELYGYEFVDSVDGTNADLALCCVPGPTLPNILEDCGKAGVGAAVIFSGGFAEAGTMGRDLQDKIRRIADTYNITILGPNTAGYILPRKKLFSSFVPGFDTIEPGNIAIVAQSGGVGVTSTFQLDREGYGIAGMFGLGNRVNTDFDKIIPLLDKDDQTKAIALHIEGTDKMDSVMNAIHQAKTPIVALKSGNNMEEFVSSHTAAPIQKYEQYEKDITEAGGIMASSIAELLDASRVLAKAPIPDGPNVGIVTAQAGPGIMMSDYLLENGANFPELSNKTHKDLENHLLGFTYDQNPVDTGRPMPEFGDVIDIVARDDNIDIVLVYEIYEGSLGYPVEELSNLTEAVDKPIIFTVAGPHEHLVSDRKQIENLGIPTFDAPERGAYATSVLIDSI